MLWCLDMLLKELENKLLNMDPLHEKEQESLMEDERNGKTHSLHTHWNPNTGELCHKIVAVLYFIWQLGLRMWLGSVTVN